MEMVGSLLCGTRLRVYSLLLLEIGLESWRSGPIVDGIARAM